jgi:hypothetical protein
MKWIYLIIIILVGCMLYYGLFLKPAPKGTLHSTAEAFVAASLSGDMARVRELCTEECAASAEQLAKRIHAAQPDPNSFSLSPSVAKEPRKALTGMFQGSPITFEMIKQGNEWKIVAIGM